MPESSKKNQEKKGSHQVASPAVVGAVGAVVGAGVGVAATMAMNDEKTRERVKEVFNEAKDQVMQYAKEVSQQAGKNPQVKQAREVVESVTSGEAAKSVTKKK